MSAGQHEAKSSGFNLASLQKYNKATIAVCGFLASLISQGALHGNVAHIVTAVLAAATAVGVWAVPNVGYVSPPAQASPGSFASEGASGLPPSA